MAQTVVIRGTHNTAKIRNPVGPVGLALITFGIYYFFWWYKINREMADLGNARQTTELGESPGLSVLAFMSGPLLLFIAHVWTIVGTTTRIRRAQELTAAPNPLNGWVAGLLWIFGLGIGGVIYTQVQMNKIWRSPDETAAALGPPPDQAAAPMTDEAEKSPASRPQE